MQLKTGLTRGSNSPVEVEFNLEIFYSNGVSRLVHSSPKKILIRTPNWIGDHVMAHPFYLGLQKAYPKATIHFLSTENLLSFPDTSLCETKKILSPKARRVGAEFFQAVVSLKQENYDLAYSLVASVSSALLLWAARIPLRVGFSQSGSGMFLTDALRWKGRSSGQHKAQLYLELLEYATGQVGQASEIASLNSTDTLPKARAQKRIILAPGASITLREWPYFRELVIKLAKQFPQYEIVVVGGKREEPWHSVLSELALANVQDRIGKTSLKEVIALCQESELVVANDSGVAHLAATLARTSTVVLFGPGDPHYIGPLSGDRRVVVDAMVAENTPCHPCEKPYCHGKWGYQLCLKSLSVDKVLEQITRRVEKGVSDVV